MLSWTAIDCYHMDLNVVNDYYLDSLDKLSKVNNTIFLLGGFHTDFSREICQSLIEKILSLTTYL